MIRHDLDVAKARQEQYRAEAAARRLAPRRTTSPLTAIARFVRASFEAPTLAPGSILPATH
jgi:hypothetical protein